MKMNLPWQGLKYVDFEKKIGVVMEMKLSIAVEELCESLPVEVSLFLGYVRGLRFDEKPDYAYLREFVVVIIIVVIVIIIIIIIILLLLLLLLLFGVLIIFYDY
jgi:hypothetical protein